MSLGTRGRTLAITGLVLLIAGVTAAVVLAGRSSEPEGPYSSWDERAWSVGAISADQRTLTLVYASGGCTGDRGRAAIRETRASVEVEKVQSPETHHIGCTLDLRTGTAKLRLRNPLAGRTISGPKRAKHNLVGPSLSVFVKGERVFIRLPRVAGFTGRDARRLLREGGFEVRPLGPGQARREVTETDPPYRTPIAGDRRSRTPVRLLFE